MSSDSIFTLMSCNYTTHKALSNLKRRPHYQRVFQFYLIPQLAQTDGIQSNLVYLVRHVPTLGKIVVADVLLEHHVVIHRAFQFRQQGHRAIAN